MFCLCGRRYIFSPHTSVFWYVSPPSWSLPAPNTRPCWVLDRIVYCVAASSGLRLFSSLVYSWVPPEPGYRACVSHKSIIFLPDFSISTLSYGVGRDRFPWQILTLAIYGTRGIMVGAYFSAWFACFFCLFSAKRFSWRICRERQIKQEKNLMHYCPVQGFIIRCCGVSVHLIDFVLVALYPALWLNSTSPDYPLCWPGLR